MTESWHGEFRRVIAAFDVCKDIYEAVAPSLGLPVGMYHSVSNIPFGKSGRWDGIYVNVHTEPCGIETYDLLECVRKVTAPAGKDLMDGHGIPRR